MSLQRRSLVSFLNSAKNGLSNAAQQTRPITFVIGNESADLDSLCSAVVFAYLRTYSGSNTIYVPLCNLLRADISLRPELRPVLSRAHIRPGDLITLSELPPSSQRASAPDPQKTKWILVDHNALQGELGRFYSNQVVGTIDHHDDENQVPKDCGDEPRIITKSGSCTSLVIEYCREAWDTLSTKSSTEEMSMWDEELAHLALAPILIDTSNLKDSTKVTPADTKAVEYLESKISSTSAKYSRDDYFEHISRAKADISQLSTPDILRKDYKQWSELGSVSLGISSVVKALPFLLEKAESKEALLGSICTFAADRKLSLYAIMTTSSSESGEFTRELLMLALDDIGAEAARAFKDNAAEILGLEVWGKGRLDCRGGDSGQHGWSTLCWVQKRVENSRKQVGPLLRKALHDAAGCRNEL